MENIKNLTSYVLKAFTRPNYMDESSDDDSEIEITDIVIVPAPSHTSKAKFVSKLRKFAKNHFDFIVEESSPVKQEMVEEVKSAPKAVVVSSPVKVNPDQHIQIKLQQPPKASNKRSSHVMINGNNVRRDQVKYFSDSTSIWRIFFTRIFFCFTGDQKYFKALANLSIQTQTQWNKIHGFCGQIGRIAL